MTKSDISKLYAKQHALIGLYGFDAINRAVDVLIRAERLDREMVKTGPIVAVLAKFPAVGYVYHPLSASLTAESFVKEFPHLNIARSLNYMLMWAMDKKINGQLHIEHWHQAMHKFLKSQQAQVMQYHQPAKKQAPLTESQKQAAQTSANITLNDIFAQLGMTRK